MSKPVFQYLVYYKKDNKNVIGNIEVRSICEPEEDEPLIIAKAAFGTSVYKVKRFYPIDDYNHNPGDFQTFQDIHGLWSNDTFGADRTPLAPLNHLKKEVREAIKKQGDVYEYADCFSILIDAARLAGFTMEQILKCMWTKFEINQFREWQVDKIGEGTHIPIEKEPNCISVDEYLHNEHHCPFCDNRSFESYADHRGIITVKIVCTQCKAVFVRDLENIQGYFKPLEK